ncbi:MAG TPA: hypothetical protein VJV05_08205 [Pyrinomonadaceae bacterium]|nr:hypothetical protein [Pyrinomonadaceae bacterium]
MKRTIHALIVSLVLTIAIFSQPPRRPGPPIHQGPPPVPKSKVVSMADPLNDFATKGLPRTHIFGGVPDAALAVTAAKLILANDDESLPALIGALQLAGFHVIDKDQKILYKPAAAANGTAFFDYEVVGMLRASQLGAASSLEKIGNLLAGDNPDLKRLNLPKNFFSDLQIARKSSDEQNLFFANLIFELSGAFPLSTPQSPINLVQASLIERRFLGDVIDAYEADSGQALFKPSDNLLVDEFRVRRIGASFASTIDDSPCGETDVITKYVGYESKGHKVLKIFDRIIKGIQSGEIPDEGKSPLPNILTGPKKLFKPIAGQIEKANILLSYYKLIAANMNIEAKIDIPEPMPLERTKGFDSGKVKDLTATFQIKYANSGAINCAGKAMKAISGLEVEVPDDGPLEDVPVKWEPLDRAETSPLYVDTLDGKDAYNQRTDKMGQNKIRLTGKPQKRDLNNVPVIAVPKKDRWRVSIATEKMDAKKDITKIFFGGAGLKAGPGSVILLVVEFIPEMMGKMALKSYRVDVPVRDWEPCSEDWAGTITYTKDLFKTTVVRSSRTSNGNSTGDGVSTLNNHVEVNVTLNPRNLVQMAANSPKNPANFQVDGYYIHKFEGKREADPCCGKTEGSFTTSFVSGEETDFAGSFLDPFDLDFSGGDMDFQLGLGFSTQAIKALHHHYLQVSNTNCPLEKNESYDRTFDGVTNVSDFLASGRHRDRYLDPSGDFLSGSKTYQTPDGSTVYWEWELSRCKKAR